jgi:hypothetical protein
LIETTKGWALKGRAEILGGPAISQMAIPVKTVARSVGRRIVFRGIWSTCLEISELQQAGPAIFAIDQAKNDGHGINSVVDYPTRIAALCFKPISSAGEIVSGSVKLVSARICLTRPWGSAA